MRRQGRGRDVRPWHGRARLGVALALLGAGCARGGCAGREAAGSGPLTEAERGAIPGLIAFVSERGPDKDVWLVTPGGQERRLTRGPEDDYPVAASPDGQALLTVVTRVDDNVRREQLRVQPLDGGAPVPLNAPRGRARNASWGPDGTWLVAESDAQGFSDLVRLEAVRGGGEARRLTAVREGAFEPAVSPDGTRVAFVSSREGDPEVYVMRADGTEERRLTHFHSEDWGPRWSPDGAWLAFFSSRERRERLYVVRPDGTHMRAVSGGAVTGDERELAWSPDGRKLAFVGRERAGHSRIWVADLAGGEPVALTDGAHVDEQPVWSPDGRYLAFVSNRGGDVDLYLMRADGSGQTRLTRARGADWLPRWFLPR